MRPPLGRWREPAGAPRPGLRLALAGEGSFPELHGPRTFARSAVIFQFPFPLPHLRNDLTEASPTRTTILLERKMAITSLSTARHEVGEDAGETPASGPRPVQYSQTLQRRKT